MRVAIEQEGGETVTTKFNKGSTRGFASMPKERQQEIARQGGQAVPAQKRAFSTDRALAQRAGRKGGISVPGEKRSFSTNPELARVAGKKGGQSVPDEKRSFSQDPAKAAEAGRKGGRTPRVKNREESTSIVNPTNEESEKTK